MARPAVVLKGTRDGLVIVLDEETELPKIMACLEEKLEMARDFLQGAKVIVELGKRKLTLGEAKELVKLLRSRRGLQVIGFQRGRQRVKALEDVLEDRGQATSHGVVPGQETRGGQTTVSPTTKGNSNTYKEGYTLFVRRTIRSGQTVNYHGNVVIIGDVNPGAEVIAGGDIIVMGVLRGMAHAGAAGDESAIVAALRLRPTQLRIADVFTRSPDGDMPAPEVPEVALLRQGNIVIDQYLTLGERLRTWSGDTIEEEKEELPWAK